MTKKIVIIGGVAGGASTAARLRRLDEFAEIILFERGQYISFANCGLPYHISGVIGSRDSLIVQSAKEMHDKFNIDVRIQSEVSKINRDKKTVSVTNLVTNEVYEESYDLIVISTGSQPIKPRIEGINEAKNLFTLRTIPDMDQIINYIKETKPKTASVIGGGFIGIEMMENLHHLGLKVSLIEMASQVMGMFDYEMSQIIHQNIADQGVELILNDGVKSFRNEGKEIELTSGKVVESDLIIFAIGVRPDNILAKESGLELNDRGSIKVDEYLKTSDDSIYAIGDVIEVPNMVSNKQMMAALAGPANKQGRIVANHICGIDEKYLGTLATSAAKIFDQTVASTGLSEKQVIQLGLKYDAIHIHPTNHASYYPGATTVTLKVIYNPITEEIYGAQAIGSEGVDKRIDVLATAIFAKVKVTELKNIDLVYAPPFSSAKDPVNMAGYVAENKIKGLVETYTLTEMKDLLSGGHFVLDIREKPELLVQQLPGAINIPLTELRSRLNELPKDQIIHVYCQVGTRGYSASRILTQHGFKVKNLDGGLKSYSCVYDQNGSEICFFPVNDLGDTLLENKTVELKSSEKPRTNQMTVELDACGLQCPGPIVQVYKKMQEMNEGDVLQVKASDPGFYKDIQAWASKTGNTLTNIQKENKTIIATLQKGSTKKEDVVEIKNDLKNSTIVVFSQDLDKAIAAFIIAQGAQSMGKQVNLFFTFWGLNILRKPKKIRVKKTFIEKMFGKMMPRGVKKLPISNMNMFGMGPKMIKSIMKKKNVDSLQTMIESAMALGVKITACAMSMDIMGIKKEELIDGVEIAGVATYLGDTAQANHNLFI